MNKCYKALIFLLLTVTMNFVILPSYADETAADSGQSEVLRYSTHEVMINRNAV